MRNTTWIMSSVILIAVVVFESFDSKGTYNSVHKEPDNLVGQVANEPCSSGAM